MGGLSYLEFIRSLAKRLEAGPEGWEAVRADLEAIRSALLSRAGAVVNMTADGKTLAAAGSAVSEFLHSLPQASAPLACSWTGPLLPRDNELITVPTQVSYVGQGANLYQDAGYQLSGAAYVIEKHLGTSYLWDKVRVVGGAYGGFCSFDSHSGAFTYLSYRDPNLLSTVAAYGGAPDYLRNLNLTQEEITKAIIGTIGDVDSYQLPDAKGYSALSRWLLKVTDEERQQRRDQILATSLKDFREFGQVLEVVRGDAGRVVAVTSAEKAAEAVAQDNSRSWVVKKMLSPESLPQRCSACARKCRRLPHPTTSSSSSQSAGDPLVAAQTSASPPAGQPATRPACVEGAEQAAASHPVSSKRRRALLHANPESHGVEAAAPVAVPGPGCRSDTAGPPSCTAPSSRSSQDLGGGKQAGGGAGGSCSPGIPGDQGGGEGAAAPTGPEGAVWGGLRGALSCRLCGVCYDCIAAWLHSAAAGGRLSPDAPGPHCPVPGCGTWLGPSAFDTFRLTFDAVLDGLVRASFPRPGLDEQLAWRRQQREEAEALEACSAPPGLARRATCCPSS
ncbi:Metalloenzyme, LuxS/M16 peptidase-like protein [Haematococcus lacustris]